MLDTSLGHGRCPLDSRQGSSPCIPRRRCHPAPDPRRFALGTRARAFPLHPAQALSPCTRPTGAALWIPGKGLTPCIPRRHSVLHPATQKNGIALIPLFVWIRRPDTALVSPSATQAAHESIGSVEIFIRDFAFPAAFIRSTDSLHGTRQITDRFGYGLPHDGLQRFGIRKTGGAVSFFCQRFHDGGCIGARAAP